MSAAATSSLIDSGVWDGWGKSLGDVQHPPMEGEALLAYPCCHLLGPCEAFDSQEEFTSDLIIRPADDGRITHDVLLHAVAVMDRGGTITVLAWTSDALHDAIDAVLRMCGGGRA